MFKIDGFNLPEVKPDAPASKKSKSQKQKQTSSPKIEQSQPSKPVNKEKRSTTEEHAKPPKKQKKSKQEETSTPKSKPAAQKPQPKDSKPVPVESKPVPSTPKPEPVPEPAAAKSTPPARKLTPLQLKMQQKLSGSRFRWINELLYTTKSTKSLEVFQQQPQVFTEYHDGFRHQVEQWPENPVLSFVDQFKQRLTKPLNAPGGLPGDKQTGVITVADMGCGEAQLALELNQVKVRRARFEVHSFDLHKANERITVADIARVPLPHESCDVVVFCLALMGTNLADFIAEGIRILKNGGLMWIAEIKSRFADQDEQYEEFITKLKNLGLYHKTTDDSNKMFVKFEFIKLQHRMDRARSRFEDIQLKPCIYKRR